MTEPLKQRNGSVSAGASTVAARSDNKSEGVIGVGGSAYVLCGGIPQHFHTPDLRAHFSSFTERFGFACFHYKHRIQFGSGFDSAGSGGSAASAASGSSSGSGGSKSAAVKCCLIRLRRRSDVALFFRLYDRQRWTNRFGDYSDSVCTLTLPATEPPLPPVLRFAHRMKPAAPAAAAAATASRSDATDSFLTQRERKQIAAHRALLVTANPKPAATATAAAASAGAAAAAAAPIPSVGPRPKSKFTGKKSGGGSALPRVGAKDINWDQHFTGSDGGGGGGASRRREQTLLLIEHELTAPLGLPAGNVGTPTALVLRNAHLIPPQALKKLGVSAVLSEHEKQKQFHYKYQNAVDSAEQRRKRILTTGHDDGGLPEGDDTPAATATPSRAAETEEERRARWRQLRTAADEDEAEEWDRHESINPVLDDGRGTERMGDEPLFEEEVALPWDKGGSGLVFYTDQSVHEAARGDFDEKTVDDWDVDVSRSEYGEVARDGQFDAEGGEGGVGRPTWHHSDWRDDADRPEYDTERADTEPGGIDWDAPNRTNGGGAGGFTLASSASLPDPTALSGAAGCDGHIPFASRSKTQQRKILKKRKAAVALERETPAVAGANSGAGSDAKAPAPAAAATNHKRIATVAGRPAVDRDITALPPYQHREQTALIGDSEETGGVDPFDTYTARGTAGRMIRAMGWSEGQGLGRRGQGVPHQIEAVPRDPTERSGLGYGRSWIAPSRAPNSNSVLAGEIISTNADPNSLYSAARAPALSTAPPPVAPVSSDHSVASAGPVLSVSAAGTGAAAAPPVAVAAAAVPVATKRPAHPPPPHKQSLLREAARSRTAHQRFTRAQEALDARIQSEHETNEFLHSKRIENQILITSVYDPLYQRAEKAIRSAHASSIADSDAHAVATAKAMGSFQI